MTRKFQNKYRIESTRLQNWDYGWPGAYFITICTNNRECYFGNIENGDMKLSQHGDIANEMWYEITKHSKHIELGEFVVMPNHVHGILIKSHENKIGLPTSKLNNAPMTNTTPEHSKNEPNDSWFNWKNPASTSVKTIGQQRFQNQGKNTISSIVGGYKSAVTKHIHRLGFDFAWQSRFYDHIIRNEHDVFRISAYIKNNPQQWIDDRFNNFEKI